MLGGLKGIQFVMGHCQICAEGLKGIQFVLGGGPVCSSKGYMEHVCTGRKLSLYREGLKGRSLYWSCTGRGPGDPVFAVHGACLSRAVARGFSLSYDRANSVQGEVQGIQGVVGQGSFFTGRG